MILFHQPSEDYGFLSPEDPESFTVDRVLFSTVVQYFVYSKAMLSGDRETARKILDEHDPFVLNGFSRVIRDFDELRWNGQKGAVLYRGLAERFREHPEMVPELMATGEETLVYCDPVDGELGIRRWKSDPEAQDPSKWRGQNLLGFTLMELRAAFRNEMPEAVLREPDNAGSSGTGARKIFGFPPYSGKEPYVYLNYSRLDTEEAAKLAGIIRDLGYPVWYDDQLETGRIWTGRRSRAVEGSMATVELYTADDRVTHIECLAREFGSCLGIPDIFINTVHTDFEDDEGSIHGKITDEDFPARLKAALERAGKASGTNAAEKRKGASDLAVRYYSSLNGKHGMFRNDYTYKCNLRTREKFRKDGTRVMNEPRQEYRYGRLVTCRPEPAFASDEEVYRAALWLREGFEAVPASAERDYIGTREDWAFDRRLAALKTGTDPEIEAEYKEKREKIRESREGYPYMDEFEYINSLFDDD